MLVIPTIAQLYDICRTNLENEFDATINPNGKQYLDAQAAADAAALHLQYLAIAETQKNIFVDTCDEETLIRFGLVKIGRLPFAAVAGQYIVSVTGTTGGVIPANSSANSDDDSLNPGILYVLDTAYTMPANTGAITLRSLTLGTGSKLDIGDTLTFTAPIPLVNSGATVVSESVQPLAAETIAEYRAIVKAAFQLEAQGGAPTDYRLWTADAQGVRTVYPYAATNSPSRINLFIEATIADSTDGKGTPSQSIINEVEDVVEFDPDTSQPQNQRGRRPLQVVVNYLPITPLTVVITITGYQGLTATIQAQLLTAFTASIYDIRPFIAAADAAADKNDILDDHGLINTILTTTPGAVFTGVTFTVAGASLSTYTFANSEIPYLNPTIIYN